MIVIIAILLIVIIAIILIVIIATLLIVIIGQDDPNINNHDTAATTTFQ